MFPVITHLFEHDTKSIITAQFVPGYVKYHENSV